MPATAGGGGASDGGAGGHVFLSYNWGCQALVLEIAGELKRRGFCVWIDVEQMKGDMNQRMAEAVEVL